RTGPRRMRAHSDRTSAAPRQGRLKTSPASRTTGRRGSERARPMATRRRLTSVPKTAPKQDIVDYAREVIRAEAEAVAQLSARLNGGFARAVELVRACPGRVVVPGTGQA